MSGNKIALDTNQAIAWLNGRPGFDAWIAQFSAVCLPVIVAGELRFGAIKSQRSRENLNSVLALISRCIILDVNNDIAEIYGDLRYKLLKRGRPIPENDLWIAAICVQNGMLLATGDSHFSEVMDLTVVTP